MPGERAFVVVAGYKTGLPVDRAAEELYRAGFSKVYKSLSAEARVIGWYASKNPEDLLDLRERALSTEPLKESYWWIGVYKESPYAKGYTADEVVSIVRKGQGLPWLVAYPMKKSPEWYLVPLEDRRRIMGEHIRIARETSGLAGEVRSYTTYAFGLAGYEFLVIYEVSDIAGWVEVVEKLREARARKWVVMEEPVLVGRLIK